MMMRTTVDIETGVLRSLKSQAAREKITLGKLIERIYLRFDPEPEIIMRNGIPVIKRGKTKGTVTPEHIEDLREDISY